MITVEELVPNSVWLLRGHKDGCSYGDDWSAMAVVQNIHGQYWMKGFISKDKLDMFECLRFVKEYFNIDKVYFVRKNDLKKLRSV